MHILHTPRGSLNESILSYLLLFNYEFNVIQALKLDSNFLDAQSSGNHICK